MYSNFTFKDITMKFKFTALAVALFATSSAHAVFNVYNSGNGTTLDIHGEVNLQLQNKGDFVEDVYSNASVEATDKRTRFGNDSGSSWIEFRGSQTFGKDYRATGVIGYGYKNAKMGGSQDTTFLAVDKRNFGSVAIGRQYLHTGYVMRTGTFGVLDDYGYSVLRADFTKIPNLHLSAFYNLPDSIDIREQDGLSRTSGKGASFSYLVPFKADHSLRFAGGYTTHEVNVDEGFESVIPRERKAYAGSLEYKKDRFVIGADFGKEKTTHNENTLVDKGDITVIGGKLGYFLNPKIALATGYGVEKYKREGGITSTPIEDIKAELPQNALGITEFIHDDEVSKRFYVRGDYYARENVRFYARYDLHKKTGHIQGQLVSREKAPEYRVGVSISF